MQPDGIHPSAEGVALIVEALGPEVEALIARVDPLLTRWHRFVTSKFEKKRTEKLTKRTSVAMSDQREETHDDPYDIFVIGGGINGCGIARDAAGRGLSVCVAEQGDLAGATSSASTKLFHGGLALSRVFRVPPGARGA
jgi:hypothetical protein